jgi:DNA polymerase-3 subunit delta
MVFKRLDELAAQNYDPFEIVSIIGFSMTDIYRAKLARSAGLGYDSVVKDFKYPKNREFAVRNAYSECGNISLERIRQTLNILSKTDLKLKTRSGGKDSDKLTLEQGIAGCMALRC